MKKSNKSTLKGFWNNRSKAQKGLIIAGISLLLVIAIIVGSAGIYLNSILSKIERDDDFNQLDNSNLGFVDIIDKDIYNIALFGIDTQKTGVFDGNSDSIMILSLNKKTNTIKLVSVMRDSLVPIENKGKTKANKINSAYANGGPSLAIKTLNTCFGLDISEYATVNFFGMIDIIDEVGGIEAEITKSEITCSININTHIRNQCFSLGIDSKPYLIKEPGKQHLNGIQAVAYARVRYGTNWLGSANDFGRTERQRYVMEQLLDKALSLDITSYPSLVTKLAPYVKTSFSNSELLSLAMFLKDKPNMETTRIPHDEYIINSDFRGTGASSIYFNYEYASKVLHAYLYDNIEPADYMEQNGVDKSGWYNTDNGGTSSKKPSGTSSKPDTSDVQSEASSDQTESSDITSSDLQESTESVSSEATSSADVQSEATASEATSTEISSE